MDPPRNEVKVAVAECRAAGIRPVMVTGGHKATGLAIATALSIAREGDIAVDGAELEKMPAQDLRAKRYCRDDSKSSCPKFEAIVRRSGRKQTCLSDYQQTALTAVLLRNDTGQRQLSFCGVLAIHQNQ